MKKISHFCPKCVDVRLEKVQGTKSSYNCPKCGYSMNPKRRQELGRRIAKIHAKKYGHRVSGELGIAFGYDYRTKEKKKAPP